jgi:hypothetical protein
VKESGEPCAAPPLLDGEFCFWHSPDHAKEASEARRLGGLRRRRESTVSGAYDVQGLRSIDDAIRLLELTMFDTLELANSVARSRVLASLAIACLKALEAGEQEERIRALEEALHSRMGPRGRKR